MYAMRWQHLEEDSKGSKQRSDRITGMPWSVIVRYGIKKGHSNEEEHSYH